MTEKTLPEIIYFHGYGSSPATDKVRAIKKHFPDVHAFAINVDPTIAIPSLTKEIENILLGTINSHKPLVFVGTSLGAWYAAYFAKKFGVHAVLINPAYSFAALKTELGIAEDIKSKYEVIGFQYPEDAAYFIATNDEVIDFTNFHPETSSKVKIIYNEEADHRYNGAPFDGVIEYLQSENF